MLRGVVERVRAQLAHADASAGRSAREQSIQLARATGLIAVPTALVAVLVFAAAQHFLHATASAAWSLW